MLLVGSLAALLDYHKILSFIPPALTVYGFRVGFLVPTTFSDVPTASALVARLFFYFLKNVNLPTCPLLSLVFLLPGIRLCACITICLCY